MREILYIQAGPLANHIGTHFWNTQEAYQTQAQAQTQSSAATFQSRKRGEVEVEHDSFVDHDISFSESRTSKGESILTPRVLMFDHKENFGNTSNLRISADVEADADDAFANSLWQGNFTEVHQAPLPTSKYHASLDTETEDQNKEDIDLKTNIQIKAKTNIAADSRYWSDYSRVYYNARSFQRLPTSITSDWNAAANDWGAGREVFRRYDADTALMDDSLRAFVEECDLLQGVQLMHDTTTFGPFVDAFLSGFRDEFPKLTALCFPLLSEHRPTPGGIDVDDTRGLRAAVNDALILRNLNELGTLSVPLQPPSSWSSSTYLKHLGTDIEGFDARKPYFSSAILSAHIESVTLPARLRSKASSINLSNICAQLDWRNGTRFAHLTGSFPQSSGDIFSSETEHDLSVLVDTNVTNASNLTNAKARSGKTSVGASAFARLDVSRGLSPAGIAAYDSFSSELKLREPFIRSIHLPAYPLPSSFPILSTTTTGFSGSASTSKSVSNTNPRTACMHSALSTSSSSASLFRAYATLVKGAISRNADVGSSEGLERDELRELEADLWTLHDVFADEDGDGEGGPGGGEDEVYDDE